MGDQVIVVGGGLAGFSAACTALENGSKVVVIDKSAFCGGNSSKATSGINGAETKTQKELNIPDTVEQFINDTVKGGSKKPELAKVLCENSGPDVNWLMDVFGLDLSKLARLGGHSYERTHRGGERFPGMTITSALINKVEDVCKNPAGLAKIINRAKVVELIRENGSVCGVVYEKGGVRYNEYGPVILATGGFAADFSESGILAEYRPDLLPLSTTNGEHCTGDGIKLGMTVDADCIDLEWVQVHPTGLVCETDKDAKVKFLAAEALRGEGGLLLDAKGYRFSNELGRRDYVSGRMFANEAPFYLILNSKSSAAIHWHCEHYKGRRVMRECSSGEELAKYMNIDPKVLEKTFNDYSALSKKCIANPNQGEYDAYPSGKTFDKWGKKYFPSAEFFMNDSFHVAIVTPVVHYTMGGLSINSKSEVIKKDNTAVEGLYAAGEVAGGIHGENRLGGNSLLDCVVYGRLAGRNAARAALKKEVICDLNELAVSSKTTSNAPIVPQGPKEYTMEEVSKHKTESDCWVVIDGKVLDVTSFLPDHPGGKLAITTFAGRDATHEFNMIHPPDVIEKYTPEAIIGILKGSNVKINEQKASIPSGDSVVNDFYWGNWKDESKLTGGVFGSRTILGSILSMVTMFILELCKTIFSITNFQINGDRKGLTRSAIFLIMFQVIHAIGNLHFFLGPDDFNGYGYFYVRLYWTGFGFNANIVEEYLVLAGLIHVIIGIKRTFDNTTRYPLQFSAKDGFGPWNLAITGIFLLGFLVVHLVQFRFGATSDYSIRPPPYLINFSGLTKLKLFYTEDKSVPQVNVRDIYRLEWELFKKPGWVLFYLTSVLAFFFHFALGWIKLVPASHLAIPRAYHSLVKIYGVFIAAFVALCYFSFPIYVWFKHAPKVGFESQPISLLNIE